MDAPSRAAVTISNPTSFSVGVTGTDLNFRWFKDDLPLQGPSATSATLSIDSVQLSDAGIYQVVVSNGTGSVKSDPAALSVVAQAGIVTELPQNQTVNAGTPVTFRVLAIGEGLTYHWQLGPVSLKDRTGSLFIAHASAENAGNYSVTVANKAGVVAVGFANLKVVASAPF
jgi:Immunoglobulin I-set domain